MACVAGSAAGVSLRRGWCQEGRRAAEREGALRNEIGLTTGSFMRHIAYTPQAGRMRMLDLPAVMRDQLDMRVLDLMSQTLESFEPAYLERLRGAADRAGCTITNLKLNHREADMGAADPGARARALKIYRDGIDAAHHLGGRWVRPRPGAGRADLPRIVDSFRELIEYGGPKGVSLLVENNGWLSRDPNGIPALIRAVGPGLAAAPDTGNWDDTIRFQGLAAAFPLAVTCDFKAFELEADGSHPRYDLEQCFEVAWSAGFRGPWCIEHFDATLEGLLDGFVAVRDRLRAWIDAKADDRG